MFMQKFKASLRFLGILFVRILAGIVVGYLWCVVVAYIFSIAAGVSLSYVDVIDRFYDTGPPKDDRYFGFAGEIYGFAWRTGMIGAWGFIVLGFIWGFSQGRLDFKRWLRRRHA